MSVNCTTAKEKRSFYVEGKGTREEEEEIMGKELALCLLMLQRKKCRDFRKNGETNRGKGKPIKEEEWKTKSGEMLKEKNFKKKYNFCRMQFVNIK